MRPVSERSFCERLSAIRNLVAGYAHWLAFLHRG
jgi:hypothetical protein